MITLENLKIDDVLTANRVPNTTSEIRVYLPGGVDEDGNQFALSLVVDSAHPLFNGLLEKFQISFEDSNNENNH